MFSCSHQSPVPSSQPSHAARKGTAERLIFGRPRRANPGAASWHYKAWDSRGPRRRQTPIAALADGQQDAVRLFYLQGLSHREVAEELGISVGAVKARLHQARAKRRGTPPAESGTAEE